MSALSSWFRNEGSESLRTHGLGDEDDRCETINCEEKSYRRRNNGKLRYERWRRIVELRRRE